MARELFSKYACKYEDAIRLENICKEDFRNPFFRDIDKIIYSLAYLRYLDKTQVFSLKNNDHVVTRLMHVQYVSKIARTIGRELNLNEDLIEAAALGHDLGHTPFGHVGESILNKISMENGLGYFNHNVHSVRVLKDIENYGKGLNITYQVLDAILCHNGEMLNNIYKPSLKSKDEFLKEYENTYHKKEVLVPATLEGCVVRISDIIGYIGKDLEDAIRLGVISKSDIPKEVVDVLGSSNSEIINTIINDIVINSKDKGYINLSKDVYDALNYLKKFNYENIYVKSYSSVNKKSLEKDFYMLFNVLKDDVIKNNVTSSIVSSYLNSMSPEYKKESVSRIVIDYIAGMTDTYFMNMVKNINKENNLVNTKKEVDYGN